MFIKKIVSTNSAVLLFSLICLYSCNHTKGLVKNTYAYYSERIPGTVPTDENGNPGQVKPDTVLVVYIETSAKDITWDTAWTNNRAYKIIPQFFETGSYEAGFEKLSKEKIFITTDPGHFLYQLYLQPLDNKLLPPKAVDGDGILLKGQYKGKTFLKKTGAVVELETYPSV